MNGDETYSDDGVLYYNDEHYDENDDADVNDDNGYGKDGDFNGVDVENSDDYDDVAGTDVDYDNHDIADHDYDDFATADGNGCNGDEDDK